MNETTRYEIAFAVASHLGAVEDLGPTNLFTQLWINCDVPPDIWMATLPVRFCVRDLPLPKDDAL